MSRLVAFSALIATSALLGCSTPSAVTSPAVATPPTSVEAIGETRPGSGVLNGYLPRAALPDSLALLPPPPLAGSPAAQADEAVFRQTRALAGSPRWALAAQDANLQFPAAAGVFACSLGFDVTPEQTPHLYTLLRRTLPDAGLSTYKAKDHYKRLRPFAALGGTNCTPDDEAKLAKDGSYPSGHSAPGLGLGPHPGRAGSGQGQRHPGPGHGLRPKPRDLWRALAKRRRPRPHDGCRHRGPPACRSGVQGPTPSRRQRGEAGTGSRQAACGAGLWGGGRGVEQRSLI